MVRYVMLWCAVDRRHPNAGCRSLTGMVAIVNLQPRQLCLRHVMCSENVITFIQVTLLVKKLYSGRFLKQLPIMILQSRFVPDNEHTVGAAWTISVLH